MTLASDPFGLFATSDRSARSAATVRSAGSDLWRGFRRLLAVTRRDAVRASPAMAESSWQAGFAAMWDHDAISEDDPDIPAPDHGGMKFL